MLKRVPLLLTLLLALSVMGLPAAPIDWSKCPEVQTGVLHYAAAVDTPRLMKINVLRVDLQTPGLLFVGTPRAEHWGEPMPDYPELPIRTLRETTVKFMENMRKPVSEGGQALDLIAAVNGSLFAPWCKPFNHKYSRPAGLVISQGVLVSDAHKKRPVFVVYRDGRPDIVPYDEVGDFCTVWVACSGFHHILKKGVIDEKSAQDHAVHPRTAYGLSADRRYLYLLTVDGRQKDWSIGAELKDLAEILLDAGASDGINMDGGGSTTMTYFDRKTQKPVTLSRQDAKGVIFRSVGHNLGIAIRKRPDTGTTQEPEADKLSAPHQP